MTNLLDLSVIRTDGGTQLCPASVLPPQDPGPRRPVSSRMWKMGGPASRSAFAPDLTDNPPLCGLGRHTIRD